MKNNTFIGVFVASLLFVSILFVFRKSMVRSATKNPKHSAPQLSPWIKNNEIIGADLSLKGII